MMTSHIVTSQAHKVRRPQLECFKSVLFTLALNSCRELV